MDDKKVGDIIHDRRTELNMSLDDVARAMGTSKATVSRWESGVIKNLKLPYLRMLSQILYMPIEAFLGDDVVFEDPKTTSLKIHIKKKIDSVNEYEVLKQIGDFTDFVTRK